MGHKSATEKDSGVERERDGKSEGGLHHHLSDRLKAHLRALKLRPVGNISQHRKPSGQVVCSISVKPVL